MKYQESDIFNLKVNAPSLKQRRNSPTFASPSDVLNQENQQMTYQEYKKPHHQYYSPQPNIYKDENDQPVSCTAKQKKLYDTQSRIFYEPTPSPQGVVDLEIRLGSQSLKWTDPNLGNTRSPVNENCVVPPGYAKQRKYEEFQTQCLPATSNKIEELITQHKNILQTNSIILNDPNKEIRRQNQKYSDMFGQKLGYQELNKIPYMQRQLSPKLEWTQYDSVRNAKDNSTYQYQSNKSPNNNNVTTRSKNQDSVTEIFLRSNRQLTVYKELTIKFKQEPLTVEKPIFRGMYQWKNNYVKKK